MVKSIHHDPQALEEVLALTRLGARPDVVVLLMRGYRSTEVVKVCREYAARQAIALPKGPLAADDARETLTTSARRTYLSGALALHERSIREGMSPVQALLRSYAAYAALAEEHRGTEQFVGFERYYVTVRALEQGRLSFANCFQCSTRYLVSDNPEVRRDCPFCPQLQRLFRKSAAARQSGVGAGRLQLPPRPVVAPAGLDAGTGAALRQVQALGPRRLSA